MPMNPRIGQGITMFFIVAMIALWIVSIFFPIRIPSNPMGAPVLLTFGSFPFMLSILCEIFFLWFVVKGKTPRCDWQQDWGWDEKKTSVCPSACAFNYVNCTREFNTTWQCPPSLTGWRSSCKNLTDGGWKCERQNFVEVSVWGIVIGVCCFSALVLLLYILSFFVIGATAAIVLLILNMFFSLTAVVAYAVGVPLATKDDYIDSYSLAKTAACASDNNKVIFFGCGQFVVTHTQLCGTQTSTFTWGPGTGWIIHVVGLLCGFLALMAMVLIGRGKRKLNMF